MRIRNGTSGRLNDGLRLTVSARGDRAKAPGLEIAITLPPEICDELGLILRLCSDPRQMEPSAQAINLVQHMVDDLRDESIRRRAWADGEPRRDMIPREVE